MRETTLRCDEIKSRVMIILRHDETVESSVGELKVKGLRRSIRVWLMPGSPMDLALDGFCKNRLVPKEKSDVKRSDVWRAWEAWSPRNARDVNLDKRAFLKLLAKRYGEPVKSRGIMVYRGVTLLC